MSFFRPTIKLIPKLIADLVGGGQSAELRKKET
jgi:hypothetical protein